jgi:Zn ribbon nucleic-acid-binding protein
MLDRPDGNPGMDRKGEAVYAFPSRGRCPDCGSTATLATCTKGQIQHRKCLACECRYKVTGWQV